MNAKAIQVCGTGSGVGKSVIAAGLCRIFLQDGYKVAPFKAQNMSLNSFVTPDGGEIGRAQAMQAEACCLNPSVDMNPILLKPTSDVGSQVILRGKPLKNMSAVEYKNYKGLAGKEALKSFGRLSRSFDLIVIEGAGSPAEINLKSHDIVNMRMARSAGANVILVGDIDKGGVFAWLVGTMELLTNDERKMVKGFIINKFRGDKRLLKPGLDFLEKRTGVKVLGVIPYYKDIKLPDEDSVSLDKDDMAVKRPCNKGIINIAVIKLPHISNFTDFDPLKNEGDVDLRYVDSVEGLSGADIIIIPGTKNVFSDMTWLRKTGLSEEMVSLHRKRGLRMIIGICGGYQILGLSIRDSYNLESNKREVKGLGVLPVDTTFSKSKVLAQVKAKEEATGLDVSGYEIHHGRTRYIGLRRNAFTVYKRQGRITHEPDGYISADGRAIGTYIHGVFDQNIFRRNFLNRIRRSKGLSPVASGSRINLNDELNKLARLLRDNLDIDEIKRITIC